MELLWWLIAIVLMAVGLLGTVLPVVPGTTIILAAAILHQIMLGPEKSLGWWNIARAGFAHAVVVRDRVVERLFRRETIWRDKMGNCGSGRGWNRRAVLSVSRTAGRPGRGRGGRGTHRGKAVW